MDCYNQMGNSQSQKENFQTKFLSDPTNGNAKYQNSPYINGPVKSNDKKSAQFYHLPLVFTLRLTQWELQPLVALLKDRMAMGKHPNFVTIKDYEARKQTGSQHLLSCQQFSCVVIRYHPFDSYLGQWKMPMPQLEIEKVLYSVGRVLQYLLSKGMHHGDITTKMICHLNPIQLKEMSLNQDYGFPFNKANSNTKSNTSSNSTSTLSLNQGSTNGWCLIDNFFFKGGITAYEKVLQGEEAFISPQQMEKIRHGFVRQSPAITEQDDMFALGITCLEMMTGVPGRQCYKQSYIRFNQEKIAQLILMARQRYTPQLINLVQFMIKGDPYERLDLAALMQSGCIIKHSGKYSLRPYGA